MCSYDLKQETEEGEKLFGHRGHVAFELLEGLQILCLPSAVL